MLGQKRRTTDWSCIASRWEICLKLASLIARTIRYSDRISLGSWLLVLVKI